MDVSILDRPHMALVAVAGLCGAALGGALIAQFGLGIDPCTLCYYQRVPYALVGALALGTLVARPGSTILAWVFALCVIGFLAESGIALFHHGVEQKWWTWDSECTGSIPMGLSMEDLKAALNAASGPRCDEINWTIAGLSVTAYNTALGALGALGCGAVFWRLRARRA